VASHLPYRSPLWTGVILVAAKDDVADGDVAGAVAPAMERNERT